MTTRISPVSKVRNTSRIILNSRAFTLIELLVVISIIGLLSSVILASLTSARNSANNAKRFSDLREVQTALDAYYADNGQYPLSAVTTLYSSECAGLTSGHFNTANPVSPLIPGLAPTYIGAIPTDPVMSKTGSPTTSCYSYKSNGTDYKFMDWNPQNSTGAPYTYPAAEASLNDPEYPSAAWSVYSSGARLW